MKNQFKIAYRVHRSHDKAVCSGRASGRGDEFLLSLTPAEFSANQQCGMEAWQCLMNRVHAEYLHDHYVHECKASGLAYLDLQHRFF